LSFQVKLTLPSVSAISRLLTMATRWVLRPTASFAELVVQVASAVDWAATLQVPTEADVDRVLEPGLGRAIVDMMRSTPSLRCPAAPQRDFALSEG
jgi:hypothetical protein